MAGALAAHLVPNRHRAADPYAVAVRCRATYRRRGRVCLTQKSVQTRFPRNGTEGWPGLSELARRLGANAGVRGPPPIREAAAPELLPFVIPDPAGNIGEKSRTPLPRN